MGGVRGDGTGEGRWEEGGEMGGVRGDGRSEGRWDG